MLRKIWDLWKTAARIVARYQARLLLTLFYFLILAPFALVVRAFSDPLRLKGPFPSNWTNLAQASEDRRHDAMRQY
jgi:hypothetical protein